MHENRDVSRAWYSAAAVVAIIIFALRPLSLLWPDARLWGVNHVFFLPVAAVYAYLVAGALIALLMLPAVRNSAERIFARIADCFDGLRRPWVVAGCALVALAAFWFLRIPTNLLGDGYSVINNIGNDIPVVFKWSEVGAVRLVYLISLVVPVEGLARGEYAYAIVSVLSGAVTVPLFAAVSRQIVGESSGRLFLFCLLVASGWLLLFFGYAENYPLLWPVITAYVFTALRYLDGRGNLWWPLGFLALSLFLHLQVFFFVASLLVLLPARGLGQRIYARFRPHLWISIGILVAAGITLFVWKYQTSLGFRSHILPPFTGRPIMPDYAIFSWSHLVDILNLLFLLAPLWPLLILAALPGLRRIPFDAADRFLGLFSLGGLVMLLIVDPRLGMGRDWDLFALAALGPLLLLTRRAAASGILRRWYPALVMLAIIVTLPFLITNLNREPSIRYMQSLLHLDIPRARSGMIMLRNYLADNGDITRADAIDRDIKNLYPTTRLADAALQHSEAGRFDRALSLADSIQHIDPYSVNGYNVRAMINIRKGELEAALVDLKKSADLARYEHRTYVHMAEIYSRTGRDSLMWQNLRIAQKLYPNSHNVLQPLAMTFFGDRRYDSALYYADRLIEMRPDMSDGYMIAGLSHLFFEHFATARTLLEHFVQIEPPGPARERIEETLKNLDEMEKAQTKPPAP